MDPALGLARRTALLVGALYVSLAMFVQLNPWREWRPRAWIILYLLGVAQMFAASQALLSGGPVAPLLKNVGSLLFASIAGGWFVWLLSGHETVTTAD